MAKLEVCTGVDTALSPLVIRRYQRAVLTAFYPPPPHTHTHPSADASLPSTYPINFVLVDGLFCIIITIIIIIIIIITDIYKEPFLSRAHSALQICTTSTIHNAQATIASNHV